MRRIRRHLTYANVMVTLLAIGALTGGVAYAANTVFSTDIVNGEVKSVDIGTGQVQSVDVKNEGLTGADIADRSLTAADLKQPEPWQNVGAASQSEDLCADPSNTAVFCTEVINGPGFTIFNPWHNYSVGFASAGFYKDQLGIVHLKGLVQVDHQSDGTNPHWLPIFRLPPSYRPTNIRVFASVGAEDVDHWEVAPSRVDVGSDGRVIWVQDCNDGLVACSGNANYVTLDGISFRPHE
jgi:hypothetical protein